MNTRITNFTSNKLERTPRRLSENTENLELYFYSDKFKDYRVLNIKNTSQKKITSYGKESVKLSKAFHFC